MRVIDLRHALLSVVCASCGGPGAPPTSVNPAEPAPRRDEPTAAPSSSTTTAAVTPLSTLSSPQPSSAPAPTASASVSPPPDPLHAAGPNGLLLWRAHLNGDAETQLTRTCQVRTAVMASCSVPAAASAREARAALPVGACPKRGELLEIPCGGCGDSHLVGGSGSLKEALTRSTRERVPSACCYAGCVPLPPPTPPNVGRPLVIEGAARIAPRAATLAWA